MTDETTKSAPAQPLAMNLLAAHVSIDAPHYKQSRFYNFPENFDALFPTPVSHADNYPRHLSALSPAAYFVDLIRLLETHIPNNDLKDRRPDLWELPLDREHTDELVPFLEIVNNVLATRLTKDSTQADGLTEEQKQKTRKKLARDLLATATYPYELPVHMPLLEIRAYLGHFEVELADVYETFQLPLNGDAWVAETLGLSLSEFKALTASNAKSLAEAYGLPTGVSMEKLHEVPTFLQQTGLTPNELAELLGVARLSLVPDADPHKQPPNTNRHNNLPPPPQRIEPLDESKWDYLNRMIRLSRRLGWSFGDLALVLPAFPRKAGWDKSLRELAQVKSLCEKYKLPVDVLRSLVGAMNTAPGFAAEGKPARDSLFDRVFNTPPFYHPSGANYSKYHPKGVGGFADSNTQALVWNSKDEPDSANEKTKKNRGIRTSLLAALHVGNDDLQAIVDHLCSDDTEKPLDPNKIKLDVPTLTRFYRLSKTAQVLGMAVQEYLLLLKCINRDGEKQLKSSEVSTLDDLRKVGDWAEWLKDSGLNAYQLDYLTSGTLSDEARHRFDAGPTDEQLAAFLPDLKPWLIQPQSFAQGTISTKAADDIHKALLEAMIIDSDGLCRTTPKPSDVVKALAKFDVLTISADDLKQEVGKTGLFTGTSLDQMVTSILAQLQAKGILDNALNLAIDTRFDNQTDLSFLQKDPTHLEDTESKTIATVRELLVRKASDIRAITDTVNQYREQQVQLTIKQLAENFHQDSHLVSSALDYLKIILPTADTVTTTGRQGLGLLLYLAKAMSLTADVFDALLKNPSLFSAKSSPSNRSFSIETLRRVHAFSNLVKTFGKHGSAGEKTAAQLAPFAFEQKAKLSPELSKLAGWEESQLKALQTHLAQMGVPGVNHKGGVNGVSGLTVMQQCFDLAAKLGVDIQTLIRLCPPLPSHAAKKQAALIFDDYSAAAHSLLAVIKAKYPTDDWEKVFGPIRDRLNERERDALAALALQSLRQTHPDKKLDSLQDLSAFLLIDVEMGGCTKASYILEAISCLQTYIERCRMQLEGDINLASGKIPDSLWSWMGHYRIWEANRKVFFYPENYIEPSQRQNTTPLFKELQSELLQGDVTDEAVTDAYINYFDKLDELANLQIVDAHTATVTNPKTGDDEETLFVIGRTSSDPPIFYLRNAVLDKSKQQYRGWTPWEKIELTIPAKEVTALYAQYRLYIFWIETKEKKEGTSEAGKKKTITKEATVKYSYQKVSGRWLQAQVLEPTIKVVWDDGTSEPPHEEKIFPVTSDDQTTIVVKDWSIRQFNTMVFEVAPIKRIPGAEVLDPRNPRLFLQFPDESDPSLGGPSTQILDLEKGTIVNSIEFDHPDTNYATTLHFTSLTDGRALSFNSVGNLIDTGGVWCRYVEVRGTLGPQDPGISGYVRGLQVGNAVTILLSSKGEDFLVRSTESGYICRRLTTKAVHELRKELMNGSLDQLLSLSAQRDCQVQPVSPQVPPRLLIYNYQTPKPEPLDSLEFDAGDPYAVYYREIFFHIPFLIADTLNKNQRFEDARKWYHYIFDPTRPLDNSKDESGMWRFLPFRGHTIDKLKAVLSDEAYHDELAEDAFDPDAIAQTRLGAYEKAVAMKYLDNLLGWGDMLFAQDSWEAINQATLLYVQALNLLGSKPKPQRLLLPPAVAPKIQIGKSNDLALHKLHEHLKLKDFSPPAHSSPAQGFDNVPDFFNLPENDEFAGYWDRTLDCLYKIRHCMNLAGVVRQLALFEAPIDPRQLILAKAAGQDLVDSAAQLTVPHYRFSVMLQQAKNLGATVIQLGSSLLNALEKKDAEDLNLLRSTQEQAILNLMRSIKERQIEDGAKHLESLGHSLDAAKYRQEHFSGLIGSGFSDAEKTNLSLDALALALQTSAAPLKGISIGGHLIPTIFGLADGGMKPGDALMVAGQLVESAAIASQQGAAMAATIAQFQRRQEDWELQQNLANYDIQQIQAELDAATIRQAIMERDLEIHDKTVEQAQARDDFYRRKFGTSDLYQWMAGRLSTVYFQTYKLALDVARSAEAAYQYERNTDASMITAGNWDSLKKGLLAGEGLMLSLNQLEKAYLDGHSREFEIEKTISLLQLDQDPVSELGKDGKFADRFKEGILTFSLKEQLFNTDFPNHYCRKIKSIAITIPAVVGPYQNVNATLTQTHNRVLLKPDTAGRDFLLGNSNTAPPQDIVRSDLRSQQQIAISRGVNDSGMFQLDFRDERYLPFEGTGAVSDWELKMPEGSNSIDLMNSISDVIIHLRYTALDGSDGFK